MARPARYVEAMAAGVLSVGVSEAEIKGHKEPGGPLRPLPVYTYAEELLRSLLGFLQIQPMTSFLGKLGFEK